MMSFFLCIIYYMNKGEKSLEGVSEFASEVGVNWSIEPTWFRFCNLAVSRRNVLSGMLDEHVA